ncbi:MAG: EAL domain-containing protein [Lachnospiraceae bacterium]|nr:EAL domain-containing protein [Lachnospiraceae bacterium]
MSIQFQLCGLFILVLLLIFYKSHRTLQLYKEKVFYAVLCIIITSLTLDILSLYAIEYRNIFPLFLVELVCKSYIVTLIWGAWSALIYVLTDLFSEKEHKKRTRQLLILVSIQSIVIYFLPIYIFADGNQSYTYGPAVICVYVFVGLYIISTLVTTCAFYKRLNPRRAFATILWMVIWMSSAIIQFFNSALMIVGFASAVGVLILFVIIENPDANLDRRLGCFNSYALTEYIKQLIEGKKEFVVLEISFEKTSLLEEQGMDAEEVMRKILHLLSQYNDILVFKNINLGLVLISQKADRLETAGKAVIDSFADFEAFGKEVMFILAMQTEAFSDIDELFHFLSFVRTENENVKGRVILADQDMITKYKEQYLVEREITDALSEDRVEVFLQPIYSNRENGFTSAEALVRIRKRDGGLLSPGIFIPVAEDNGQILELGERVFEKVCDFLQNTDVVKLGIHYIEINLSVIQCEKKDLAERLTTIIERYGVDPKLINLEITETASISARTILLENMKKLIEAGFSFSLDDFGKGESNLMYMVEMPVSIVKLDYDMSKAFFKSSKAKHVVRAVVNMAHGMDLKLVAEGIETEDEKNDMYREGIDYIQGFYYSKPLPMKEFMEFIQKNRLMVQ